MIRKWKPWKQSTGPKTEEGKRQSAMRGYKGRHRQQQREIARALKETQKSLDSINTKQ